MTLIKIVLIVSGLGLTLVLLRSHGTHRGGAYVKIAMTLFLVFAGYAVIRPDDVTWVAEKLGVGRGADLVLYLLVVGFGFFAISTYLRFKEMELKFARLARSVALSQAERGDRAAGWGADGIESADRIADAEGVGGPDGTRAVRPETSIAGLPAAGDSPDR